MQQNYLEGTPDNVKEGISQFVNNEMLIKAIRNMGTSARYVSTHVFAARGECHAPNKVGDWLKYRYPAKLDDLKAVVQFLDPEHKYELQDFVFTDYQSDKFKEILKIYVGFATRKTMAKKDHDLNNSIPKNDEIAEQTNLFWEDHRDDDDNDR